MTSGQDIAILFAIPRIGLVVPGLLVQGLLAWLLPEGRGSYAVCLVFGTLLGMLFTPGAQSGAQYLVLAR